MSNQQMLPLLRFPVPPIAMKPYHIWLDELAVWTKTYVDVGTNPQHPAAAEASAIKKAVRETYSAYYRTDIRVYKAIGVRGQLEPNKGDERADGYICDPIVWLFVEQAPTAMATAVADANFDAMQAPGADDPPTPDGPLQIGVLVYIADTDQWLSLIHI